MSAPLTSPSFPNGIPAIGSEAEARAARPVNIFQVIQAGAVETLAAQKAAIAYRLVDEKTGEEITLPAIRKCWDGVEIIVTAFKASRYEGNPGYIYAEGHPTYVPSVIGAKIMAVSDV